MSLIIETLNKMETEEFKNYVPPFFQKESKPKNKIKSKKIYIYIGLFLSLSVPSIYMANLLENANQNSIVLETKTIKEEIPVPIAQDISKVSSTEIILDEKTEINFLEKDLKQLESLQIPNSVFLSVQYEISKISIPEIAKEKKVKNQENPKNLDLEFNSFVSMADNFYNKNDFENSIKWYQKAYQIKKDEYVLNRLLILNYHQNNSKAVDSLISEIKDEQVVYSFLLNLINDDQIQLAKEILNKKINLDKNGYLLYLNGMILENQGDTKEAEKFYKFAYKKNNADPYLAYSYGRILEINKKFNQALNVYIQTQNLNLNNELKNIVKERISILRGNFVF